MRSDDIIILAYLYDRGEWTARDIEGGKLTHINYAFAKITDGAVGGGNPEKLKEVKKLKRLYPHLKVMISIGGWAAEGFSDAAATVEARVYFAKTAVSYVRRYGFDGVDLDWEYPTSSEGQIKSRPEDKENFNLLLRELRNQLNHAGEKDGKYYLLTIASGALPYQADYFDLKTLSEWTDFINVMTYDLYNGFSTMTGHHTGLYGSDSDLSVPSTKEAVDLYLGRSVPPSKLVVGCAFYGRGWDVKDGRNCGLHAPVASECQAYSYQSLVADYINKNGFTRYWDDFCKAPYLWNGRHYIGYDDPESLKHKAEFIKSRGLRGAMFWEYSQDAHGVLLDSLYSGLE